jgi:hypothetical protein
MKKIVLKPGFEFIFSLSLIIVLGLPPMLLAQNRKDVDINIVNGDTTVNGKNIKELSPGDRAVALKDLNRMKQTTVHVNTNGKDFDTQRTYAFKRHTDLDSTGNMMHGKPDNLKRTDYAFTFRDDNNNGFRARDFGAKMRAERKNTQNFDYVTTDNEGISTRVRFRVSEISNEDLKKMPHVEGGKFEITDLNVIPEFSTGKTLLMFDLPAKTIATVKLTDSEGKIIFDERINGGSFSKTFPLGLNGIYFLQVKQGNDLAIKKIIKEE